MGTASAAFLLGSPLAAAARQAAGKKGILLMNRIGPSRSELYIADADGGNERKFLKDSAFDYHASWSADGAWVVFTSERTGDGNSCVYRASADGAVIEPLVLGPAVDDAGSLSPDGSLLAFVSTRQGYKANIWVMDLKTRAFRNLTGANPVAGAAGLPDGYFRPTWSPDGKWIVFSSDRNTPWRGHDEGKGWEHTQELSVYVIRPDGSGFRRVATKPEHCLGSPRFSRDGKRIVFYEVETEGTWGAHRPEFNNRVQSQIVSVDLATGARVEHTSGPGLKQAPYYLPGGDIAYHIKGGATDGLGFTAAGRPAIKRAVRNPSWSPDGKQVIYEKISFRPARPQNKPLYSWDKDWVCLFTDVFPVLSRDGMVAITEKQNGNSSIVVMKPDGSGKRNVFDPAKAVADPSTLARGISGAFQPNWSPDGQWIAFGVGSWFQGRQNGSATLMRVRRDGTGAEALTDGSVHSGFPSHSSDGRFLVFRTWGPGNMGLRVLDLETRQVRVLTTEPDNLPDWSPDGKLIVFTRKTGPTNFDVMTIRPDGSGLRKLTESGANEGHAVWSADGRILYSSGVYGFRDEAALYDDTFQPYGQIMAMNADGSGKRMLTDSLWEDSMPLYLPAALLS